MPSHSMQTAYHLLPAVIDAGTRIFVYSGMNDTILPYEGSLVWVRLKYSLTTLQLIFLFRCPVSLLPNFQHSANPPSPFLHQRGR